MPACFLDLTAVAGAPSASSDPVSFYSLATNTKHVIYCTWPWGVTSAGRRPPAINRTNRSHARRREP